MGVETFREPGVTVGGIGITLQAQVSEKSTLAFEVAIDSTTNDGDLSDLLDRLRRAADRQKAFHQLEIKEKAIDIAHKQIEKMMREKTRLMEGHATALARKKAEFAARARQMDEDNAAAWERSGRNGPFKASKSQDQAARDLSAANVKELADFMAEHEAQLANLDKSVEEFRLDIGIVSEEVERLKVLTGQVSPMALAAE